jgi:hypothetical protein
LIAVIVCSCVLWILAFSLLFVAYEDTEGPHDDLSEIFKRKGGRGSAAWGHGATSSSGDVDIDLLIGILGVFALLVSVPIPSISCCADSHSACGVDQGICELLLYLKKFTPLEVEASYERSIGRYWYLKNLYN